jgi:spore coat polysaccharide biosynthesis protein SpsF
MEGSHSSKKATLIIQARLGSTRLPGKVLKEVLGRPLLTYLLERMARAITIGRVVVATTTLPEDDPIVELCQQLGVAIYRGSSDDVLSRYAEAAELYGGDPIVRVTSDCPLLDPAVVDRVVRAYMNIPPCDYCSNTLIATYPRGMDVEVFGRQALSRAAAEAVNAPEREHVTLYLYRHPEMFTLRNVAYGRDVSSNRWTVDTAEDFELVRTLLEALYPTNPHFTLEQLLQLIDSHPEWAQMNAHIQQKKV